jgi:hypothetical protein
MLILLAGRVNAAATMESIGAEKCGGRVNAFEVEFLAPDNAALEATSEGPTTALQRPLEERLEALQERVRGSWSVAGGMRS